MQHSDWTISSLKPYSMCTLCFITSQKFSNYTGIPYFFFHFANELWTLVRASDAFVNWNSIRYIAGVFLLFLLCLSEVILVSGTTNSQSSLKSDRVCDSFHGHCVCNNFLTVVTVTTVVYVLLVGSESRFYHPTITLLIYYSLIWIRISFFFFFCKCICVRALTYGVISFSRWYELREILRRYLAA